MRFSLVDMFFVIACLGTGQVVSEWLGWTAEGKRFLLGVPIGFLLYLVFTPPIYNHFGFLHASSRREGLCPASQSVLNLGIPQ